MFHTTGVVHICFCPSVTDGQHSHHTHISFQARLCLTSFLNGAPIDAVFNTWKSLSNVLTGGINKIAAIHTHSSIPPLEVFYILFHPPDEVGRDQVPLKHLQKHPFFASSHSMTQCWSQPRKLCHPQRGWGGAPKKAALDARQVLAPTLVFNVLLVLAPETETTRRFVNGGGRREVGE